jgi:hypothetical protein
MKLINYLLSVSFSLFFVQSNAQNTQIVSQVYYDTVFCHNASSSPASVNAIGANLTYQWYKNAYSTPEIIPNETSFEFYPSTSEIDTYNSYFCKVTGQSGSVNSQVTKVSVRGSNIVTNTTYPNNLVLFLNQNSTGFNSSISLAYGANFSGFPNGLDTLWNGVAVVSGTPTESGVFNFAITFIESCNNTTVQTGTMIVARDTANFKLSSAIGTDHTSTFVNDVMTPITYSVSNATNPYSVDLPNGVTSTIENGQLVISGTPTQLGVFNYTIIVEGNDSIASGQINVTTSYDTLNLLSAIGSDNQVICINDSITPIIYSVSNATSVNVTGLPSGVNYVLQDNQIIISGKSTAVESNFSYFVTCVGNDSIGVGTLYFGGESHSYYAFPPIVKTVGEYLYFGSNNAFSTSVTFENLPQGIVAASAYANYNMDINLQGNSTQTGESSVLVNYSNGLCGSTRQTLVPIYILSDTNSITLLSADSTSFQIINSGDSIVPINYYVNDSINSASIIVTGLPLGLSWELIGNYIKITGVPSQIGTFVYTVTFTNKSNNNNQLQGTIINGLSEVNELTREITFSIFPNPSNGTIVIKGDTTGEFVIKNSIGQIIEVFQLNHNSKTINNIPSGIYYVSALNNASNTKKFVVIR